ncbi:MAG: hypothetical protein KGJ79_03260 [Alphaproteobacteria bacterium]|nr:hypothetical protein [Alphaproteobacteria bacterium]MDE2492620.1 hypothetical protein [Alphaproteobacteria bacterium]
MSVKQKLVRDVATYFGHSAGVRLSSWLFCDTRPPVVTGKVASPRLQRAIDAYRDSFMTETELCRIMNGFGSDKGHGRHNYTVLYTSLLSEIRNAPLNLFELGIGTNNVRLKSNMGRSGRPGASLYAWHQYLSHAQIYAADIDRDILVHSDRIRCFHCDQTSVESIGALWSRPELNGIKFDLIIDDGLHEFEANKLFLERSYAKLGPGGLMIVEDILSCDKKLWIDYVAHKNATSRDASFAFVELPHAYNFVSNNVACIEKH